MKLTLTVVYLTDVKSGIVTSYLLQPPIWIVQGPTVDQAKELLFNKTNAEDKAIRSKLDEVTSAYSVHVRYETMVFESEPKIDVDKIRNAVAVIKDNADEILNLI